MKSLSVLLLFTALVTAQPNTLTRDEAAGGWILLFDGETLFGWTAENQSQWRATNGTIVADSGPAGWLRSNSAFADYTLKCEFRTAADGNSGIFLRSAKEGQPHITGYELQIFDTQPAGFNTGALVNHAKTQQPVKIRPGQWMSYEVELSGNHFLIKLDGKTVLATRDDKSRAGHIGLQFNVDKKIEFRNIKLKPLGVQSLFNGRDLKGWQVVEAARPPKQPPVWSVKDGSIHVEHGPGQLETETTFDDFILQLDVRANSQGPTHHPNSGVFLRGDPKGYWTGYESQIRNEFKGDDRSQPVDFGTGGVYHFQPARKVVSSDNEFFTKTIVARGPHIAVWVNGYPVSDYEDTRAPGMNARKEARVAADTQPASARSHHQPRLQEHPACAAAEVRVLCALFLAAVSGWAQGRAEWNARIEPNRVLGNIYYVGPLGVHLVDNAGYPNIAEDYARTFRVLKSLSCDPVGQASWPVVGSHSIQSGEAGGGAEL